MLLMVAVIGFAKDIKTLRVTTEPQMSCQNCENRIKKTIRFEKGVKEITTNLDEQVVEVVYDADKTNESALLKAFDKMQYKARVLKDNETGKGTKNCDGKKECCKEKKTCDGKKECDGKKACDGKKNCDAKKKCDSKKVCCKEQKAFDEKKACCKEKK